MALRNEEEEFVYCERCAEKLISRLVPLVPFSPKRSSTKRLEAFEAMKLETVEWISGWSRFVAPLSTQSHHLKKFYDIYIAADIWAAIIRNRRKNVVKDRAHFSQEFFEQ